MVGGTGLKEMRKNYLREAMDRKFWRDHARIHPHRDTAHKEEENEHVCCFRNEGKHVFKLVYDKKHVTNYIITY